MLDRLAAASAVSTWGKCKLMPTRAAPKTDNARKKGARKYKQARAEFFFSLVAVALGVLAQKLLEETRSSLVASVFLFREREVRIPPTSHHITAPGEWRERILLRTGRLAVAYSTGTSYCKFHRDPYHAAHIPCRACHFAQYAPFRPGAPLWACVPVGISDGDDDYYCAELLQCRATLGRESWVE